jgi:hypothetical protein
MKEHQHLVAASGAKEVGDAGQSDQPGFDQIRLRAFELYVKRGCIDGRDFDDWIEAERQLITEQEV